MPCSVSGVTTAPSEMPMTTKIERVSSVGISSGRPAKAAADAVKIAPDSQPAGSPSMPKVAPPTAAMASVSATRRRVCRRSGDGVTGRDQWRARGLPSNHGSYSKKQVARERVEIAHGAKRFVQASALAVA